jgi:hypothetical protein
MSSPYQYEAFNLFLYVIEIQGVDLGSWISNQQLPKGATRMNQFNLAKNDMKLQTFMYKMYFNIQQIKVT